MYFPDSFFNIFSVYARKLSRRLFGMISLKSKNCGVDNKKWILLSFVTHPFAITKNELLKSPHTTPWECIELAKILLEHGYNVDVIDLTNQSFIPKKKYTMVIDVHQNLERFTHYLPSNCIKIYYITGSHWKYHNKAELQRIAEFRNRRGVTLLPRRQITPSKNIEYADYVTSLGNSFAKNTYAYAHKEITQIPLLSTISLPSPQNKNFELIKKNFVWIGGGGAVHKGLDLVLETFLNLPDYNLTVCGPVEREEDFYDFYKKELCETPNIKFVGRINIRGEQFKDIMNNTIGLVYPSCSEGQSGSVITALHAGLIPIVTYQSGVDVYPFGIILKSFSVSEITAQIKQISGLSIDELRARSVSAWDYAQENHTREVFKEKYTAFVDDIIKKKHL